MTRVPKFRAWNKERKSMIPVDCIDFSENVMYYSYEERFEDDSAIFGDSLWLDDVILMQSTGFKDCNGVELFEGDIVTASGYEYMGFGVVRYEESLAGFVVEFTNRLMKEKPQFIYQFRELEVIGNIYDNKELLE